MTRSEMISYILTAIQTDETLIKLLHFIVTNNITNSTPDSLPDDKLATVVAYLQG